MTKEYEKKRDAAAEQWVHGDESQIMDTYADHADSFKAGADWGYAARGEEAKTQVTEAINGIRTITTLTPLLNTYMQSLQKENTRLREALQALGSEADFAVKAIGFSARPGDQGVADTFRFIRDKAREASKPREEGEQ